MAEALALIAGFWVGVVLFLLAQGVYSHFSRVVHAHHQRRHGC